LILVIEAAATVSIAVILTLLFIGGKPGNSCRSQDESSKALFSGEEKKIR
jgi:hypothetical protein